MSTQVISEVHLRRPRLSMAPTYELWLDEKWQQDNRYRTQQWFRWSWCRLDEVIELVNKQFDVRWTRAGLLKRFAIPREQGDIKFGDGKNERRFDLKLLWIHEETGEMHCEAFSHKDILYAGEWNMTPFVPTGWVKDVLWALFSGCTRAFRDKDGQKVAAWEDGKGVFYMTGTGRASR